MLSFTLLSTICYHLRRWAHWKLITPIKVFFPSPVSCCHCSFTMLLFATVLHHQCLSYMCRFTIIYGFSMHRSICTRKRWVLQIKNFKTFSRIVIVQPHLQDGGWKLGATVGSPAEWLQHFLLCLEKELTKIKKLILFKIYSILTLKDRAH